MIFTSEKQSDIVMVKRGKGRGKGRGKCSIAGLQSATRIISHNGLKISARLEKDNNDINFDDNLDFEPEDENSNDCDQTTPENQTNYVSDSSTLLFDSTVENVDRESKGESDNQSILSAFRGDMISFTRSFSEDKRELNYLNIAPSVTSSKTRLDSCSSSDGSVRSSCSSSIVITSDGEKNFNESLNGSDLLKGSEDEMDSKNETDPEDNDADEVNPVEDTNELDPIFKDKKVVVTNSRNIKITAFSFSRGAPSKRKWNSAFPSDQLTTSLQLKDIGYISHGDNGSDAGSDSASSMSSTSSTHNQRTTLKVTFNSSSERTFQQVGSPVSNRSPTDISSQPMSPKSEDMTFKMPLPPAKRPPSRPRRSETSSLSSFCKSSTSSLSDSESSRVNQNISQNRKTNPVKYHIPRTAKEDDSISIVASSLGVGDNPEAIDLQNPDDIKDEIYSYTESTDQEIPAEDLDREYIENWISSIQPTDRAPSSLDSPIVHPQQRNIVERPYIQLIPAVGRDGTFRIDFRTIPKFFLGLCYHHFFRSGCIKPMTCTLFHSVPFERFTAKCKETSADELVHYYRIALRFHSFLKEIYTCFLEGFAFHKMESQLISTISDYLSPSLMAVINPMEALGNIIKALEKTGLSFQETIEKISFNVGFMNYPILADILLEIISQKPNLSEYWEEIKRISRATGHVPPNIVEKILARVTSVCPLDKALCTDIYNFIVRDRRSELSKVRRDLLHPFETFVNFGGRPQEKLSDHIESHLSREREIFERAAVHSYPGWSGASSSASSGKSSVDVSPSDVSRYVPESTVRRAVQPQVATGGPNPIATLFPKKPVLGCTRYRPSFEFNVSLHNSLPECQEKICMHERDIIALNEAIKGRDGRGFLRLLDNHKNPVTVEYFITMTIAHLNNLDNYYDTLMALLNSIAQFNPEYIEENGKTIKGIFEVIVFNLLFSIEKKCHWREGRKLLEKFCDWDSLISSQRYSPKNVTPMGRYIFLAKLFTKSNGFGNAFEILQCPTLHLLEAPEKWPLFNTPYVDMESRNNVLKDFFSTGYRHNVVVVSALYEKIFKSGELYGFDAHGNFNPMLITLINEEKISSLKTFASEVFYRHMDKQILRAFIILMEGHIETQAMFQLYEFACHRSMYVKYSGQESTLSTRTNMSDSEITLMLKYYFRKLLCSETFPVRIQIDIKLPEGPLPTYPNILQRSIRSIMDINKSVRTILTECFDIAANTADVNSTEVVVGGDEIGDWLRRQTY